MQSLIIISSTHFFVCKQKNLLSGKIYFRNGTNLEALKVGFVWGVCALFFAAGEMQVSFYNEFQSVFHLPLTELRCL